MPAILNACANLVFGSSFALAVSRSPALRQELVHRRGFAMVRGLDVGRYTEQEIAVIFFGLGSHIGHARSNSIYFDTNVAHYINAIVKSKGNSLLGCSENMFLCVDVKV